MLFLASIYIWRAVKMYYMRSIATVHRLKRMLNAWKRQESSNSEYHTITPLIVLVSVWLSHWETVTITGKCYIVTALTVTISYQTLPLPTDNFHQTQVMWQIFQGDSTWPVLDCSTAQCPNLIMENNPENCSFLDFFRFIVSPYRINCFGIV